MIVCCVSSSIGSPVRQSSTSRHSIRACCLDRRSQRAAVARASGKSGTDRSSAEGAKDSFSPWNAAVSATASLRSACATCSRATHVTLANIARDCSDRLRQQERARYLAANVASVPVSRPWLSASIVRAGSAGLRPRAASLHPGAAPGRQAAFAQKPCGPSNTSSSVRSPAPNISYTFFTPSKLARVAAMGKCRRRVRLRQTARARHQGATSYISAS